VRVLLVSNTYPPADLSGVGTLVCELARRLAASGHQVRVLTRRPPAGDPLARAVGGPKVLFPLLVALRFLAGAATPWDLVHVHESDGSLLAVMLRLLRRLRVPAGRARLLATLQVSYVEERHAVRPVRADGVVVSRPTGAERRFALLRAPLLALLGRLTARLADAVVAPSAATADELRRDYRAHSVEVIPNGVALPPPLPRRAAGAVPRILYSGRLRSRKAVAVLLAAMPRVLGRVPGCRLMVVGDGEQRHALAQSVRAAGLEATVELAGALPREGAMARLAEADVFCLPSTYEGLPLAILEAMAAGIPVVATAVSGNPEAVEDGVTGMLVPAESATALADALIALLVDPEQRRRMGEAGRRRAAARFAIEPVVEQYLALLRRLTASAR
jgi:glycosyltransferase involved in cell wall biosynthesis